MSAAMDGEEEGDCKEEVDEEQEELVVVAQGLRKAHIC